MRLNKATYATFDNKGTFIPPSSEIAPDVRNQVEATRIDAAVAPSCDVAYTLESLSSHFPGATFLVLARGKSARRVFQSASEAGMTTCAVYTRDKRSDTTSKFATKTVCVGDAFTEHMLRNPLVALKAAGDASAQAILLCDESLELAYSQEFLATAQACKVAVFKCMTAAFGLGWILCEPQDGSQAVEHWQTCKGCSMSFSERAVRESGHVCPECGAYFRMPANERIDSILDANSFEEWFAGLPETDPLSFPGYATKLEALRASTQLDEAVVTGGGSLAGLDVAFAVMDGRFLMGSMGSVVGEKLCLLIDRAIERHLPVIIFCASGGARMQEGLVSLMQMAKVSCALNRLAEKRLPYFSVLTDPTTGGVTASFAMQGDIIFAEPKTLIGFAGQRVIRDTIKQELPEGFQTAEFALEHGLIDAIVPREKMRETLAHIVALHSAEDAYALCEPGDEAKLVSYHLVSENLKGDVASKSSVVVEQLRATSVLTAEPKQRRNLIEKLSELRKTERHERLKRSRLIDYDALDADGDQEAEALGEFAVSSSIAKGDAFGNRTAWDSVMLARNVKRPTASAYIASLAEGFVELHGDRMFADDGAIIGGIGWVDGRPVTIIAQEKGVDLKDRIKRNFGCPQPEGYRKSLRLMRQAEKFGRPIVCLVDTQGAFCGTEAEERGQGNAIADNLIAMAGLRVPVISVLLGEGGSGGALALAVSNRVAMQENAVYSVLSPEGFASILWKDRSRAAEAAAAMKMGAREVCEMGIVDEVLLEGEGPAHENPDTAVANVRNYVVSSMRELERLSGDELMRQRHERFARF